jgi:Uma2 family endonuclease
MSATVSQLPPGATYTSAPVYRMSVEQYHALVEQGHLTSDDPVELVEGVLVFKMPKNPPHRLATRRLFDLIQSLLPGSAHCQMLEPITLRDGEPEPDVALVVGDAEDYPDRHPSGADVLLVIEVSDATLAFDRGPKLRSYARAGIAQYWIVNLNDREIEVHTDPKPEQSTYGSKMVYREGATIPLMLAGHTLGEVRVDQILP